jgi:hypothetical protein
MCVCDNVCVCVCVSAMCRELIASICVGYRRQLKSKGSSVSKNYYILMCVCVCVCVCVMYDSKCARVYVLVMMICDTCKYSSVNNVCGDVYYVCMR